jgi:hypothetical protein
LFFIFLESKFEDIRLYLIVADTPGIYCALGRLDEVRKETEKDYEISADGCKAGI